MNALSRFRIAAQLIACAVTSDAMAMQLDYAVRATAAAEIYGSRDLMGETDGALFLNIAPRVLFEFNPDWTGYLRGRVFLPSTGQQLPFDSENPGDLQPGGSFVGLNEFWIQYRGLTSYPGEALRLGRQHIRQPDGEWWDADADALRWVLDTTLLDADIGVARQLSSYRSDSPPVPPAQRDRTYVFANAGGEWRPHHHAGLRMTHAAGQAAVQDSRLTWVGVHADSGFFDMRAAEHRLTYAINVNYLTGRVETQSLRAWQAGAGLRWRPHLRGPLQLGAAYAYSQGGESGGRSHQYQQNGMQTNSSYFSGTSTLIGRYNESLQAELGNLRVYTAFASLRSAQNDVSLVLTRLRKDAGASPIRTNGLQVAPVNADRDIGDGIDLVFMHYFTREQRTRRLLDRGDAYTAPQRRSLISLRASLFRPGTAYGAAAHDTFRVLLEVTLWRD